MKPILTTLAVIVLFLAGIWAIHVRIKPTNQQQKKLVLTTFTVIADMAREVAGEDVAVESITKPGAEIHHYEPTPQDLVRVQEADMVLDNGMNLEKWATKLYSNAPKVPHVTLTDGIEPSLIQEGPYTGFPNPHAWMSPTNALIYVDNITRALIQIAPEHEASFTKRAATYKNRIRAVDQELKTSLARIAPAKRYLVSCEGAFSYLTRDYELNELYLWPINSDSQGTPQQVRHVVEEVRRNRIPAVFCESTVGSKPQEQVVAETDSSFGGTFYVDSLSDADGPAYSYIALLEYNAALLIKGLTQ